MSQMFPKITTADCREITITLLRKAQTPLTAVFQALTTTFIAAITNLGLSLSSTATPTAFISRL